MSKLNVLILSPGPHFQPQSRLLVDRYKMLSDYMDGRVLSWVSDPQYVEMTLGNIQFVAASGLPSGIRGRLRLFKFLIREGLKYNKEKKVDAIICYEPMFTGVVGSFLKMLTGAKLIIEINCGDLETAFSMEQGRGFKSRVKYHVFTMLRSFSIHFADGIKFLTHVREGKLLNKLKKKKVFAFHDFVPTHFFDEGEKLYERFILFAGFPFYRKGIDILIKAGEKIHDKHPDITFKLVGHELEEESKEVFPELPSWVHFIKPMFYDDLQKEFLKCLCFVLPSREEGMGRVLLEAMASEKPVVGANVGGIPALIDDGKSGYLFESENIDQLAEKLDALFSDLDLVKKMGQHGKQMIHDKFSSEKYCELYTNMVAETVGKKDSVENEE